MRGGADGGRRPRLSDRAEYLAVRALLGGLSLLPRRWRHRTDGWLGRAIILCTPPLRRRIADNLALIYPDTAPERRRALMRATAANIGRNLLGLMDLGWMADDPARFVRVVPGPAVDALRAARAARRPVMVLTGHYGMFDAARLAFRAEGIEFGAVYRPQNNPLMTRLEVDRLSLAGRPMIPRGPEGMRLLFRHLRGGGAVGLLIDQKVRSGTWIEFLGRPALTSTEPAALALRMGVPVFGGFVRRLAPDRFEVVLEGPVPADDPVTMTRACVAILERAIAEDPTEWYWLHRRWAPARPGEAAP